MQPLLILISVGIIIILYFWYAAIVARKNKALEAFAGIDVQLKKRTDLIPNILTIANKFMQHEATLLQEITALRTRILQSQTSTSADGEERFALEGQLEQKLSKLFVSVENYPDLKSQQTMVELQHVWADVEQHISAARRSYNTAVGALKNIIQIFPGNILGAMASLPALPFFEITSDERKPINAGEFFK